jgi:hypothetical protein
MNEGLNRTMVKNDTENIEYLSVAMHALIVKVVAHPSQGRLINAIYLARQLTNSYGCDLINT